MHLRNELSVNFAAIMYHSHADKSRDLCQKEIIGRGFLIPIYRRVSSE